MKYHMEEHSEKYIVKHKERPKGMALLSTIQTPNVPPNKSLSTVDRERESIRNIWIYSYKKKKPILESKVLSNIARVFCVVLCTMALS